MDRGQVLLQGLRRKLEGWLPFMKRATKADVSFEARANGFAIVARWDNKDTTKGEHTWELTKEECFGPTALQPPAAWAVQGKPCDYARSFVRRVLTARGVL